MRGGTPDLLDLAVRPSAAVFPFTTLKVNGEAAINGLAIDLKDVLVGVLHKPISVTHCGV